MDLVIVAALLPLHMGSLHPFEKGLTLVLAFGPFLLLALVVYLRRGQREPEEQSSDQRER